MIPRMKIISKLTVWLGILLAIAGTVVGLWGGWIAYRQFLALDALRSAPTDKPAWQLFAAGLSLLLGGFLIGLGIGKTPKRVVTTTTTETPTSQA